MKIDVTFEDGKVTQIKIKNGSDTVGYAEHDGSGGVYITTVYPLPGHDGIKPDLVGEIADSLEKLPFAEYAKFNYSP